MSGPARTAPGPRVLHETGLAMSGGNSGGIGYSGKDILRGRRF